MLNSCNTRLIGDMAEDEDRVGVAEWEGVYEAAFEVVIESVGSDQTVRCTEYEEDAEDAPMHPDTTVFGEPYGIASRPPKDVEYLTLESKSGRDWILVADVDRPTVSAEGNTVFFDMYHDGSNWVVGSKIELAGDIKLDPRSGKKTYTTGPTYLGSASAGEKMVLGTQFISDMNVFLSAVTGWGKELQTLINAPPADAAVLTYATNVKVLVTNLAAALATWASTDHFLNQ